MTFIGLAIFMMVVGGCGLAGWLLVRGSRTLIESAGRAYGLTVKPTATTVEGAPRGYRVRLGYQPYHGNHFDIATLDLPDGVLHELTLLSRATNAGFSGDPAFDGEYSLAGAASPVALAILKPRVRQLFRGFHGKVDLTDGKLVLFYQADLTKVGEDLNRLLDLADALIAASHIENVSATLLVMALNDPEPGSRLRAARTLLEHFRDQPAAHELLRQARVSDDGWLRLLAAEVDGLPHGLPAILAVLAGGWFALEARVRASQLLHRLLPRDERVFATLAGIVGTANGRLLSSVLKVYEAYRVSPSVASVTRRLSSVRTTDRLLLLRSLALTTELEAARVLVRSHLFAKDSAIAELACQLLGKLGDIGSVEVLYQIAESATRPGDVRRAAREAIVEIQGRSGRSGLRGGLQISEEHAVSGGLSPAAGAVSGGELEVVDGEEAVGA